MQPSDSASLPPPPHHRVVLGCGQLCLDYLVTVRSFPEPDSKMKAQSVTVQGGGNTGNALTCAARLGLIPRLISKVAGDWQGQWMLEELKSDGVDTSFCVVTDGGASYFSYIIVDKQTKTRTCIGTPGYPPMLPDDFSAASLSSALDGARIFYAIGRCRETELMIAQQATGKNIAVLVDAEKPREGLDELLGLADYVVCAAEFPQMWTKATTLPRALVSILIRLPKLKFVIVTLGEHGCLMLQRCSNEHDISGSEETDIDSALETLKQRTDINSAIPICNSMPETRLGENLTGKLLIGTAEKIPPSELKDTTGAGDAFIGAVLYALCADMPAEKMLPFASQVAACCCRGLGARSALPFRTDPRLAPFFLSPGHDDQEVSVENQEG